MGWQPRNNIIDYKRSGYEIGAYLCNGLIEVYSTASLDIVSGLIVNAKERSRIAHAGVDADVRTPSDTLLKDRELMDKHPYLVGVMTRKSYDRNGHRYGTRKFEAGLYLGQTLTKIFGSDDPDEFGAVIEEVYASNVTNYGPGALMLFSPQFGPIHDKKGLEKIVEGIKGQ